MDAEKREDCRAYSRGYAAGKRRTEGEQIKLDRTLAAMNSRRQQRHDQFLCAALTGLIVKGGWNMNGKPLANPKDYVKVATFFADYAMANEV